MCSSINGKFLGMDYDENLSAYTKKKQCRKIGNLR